MSRNPFIIPDDPNGGNKNKPMCPLCKKDNYTGKTSQGVILFSCLNPDCKNQWQGGLPREPEDPRIPKAPVHPKDRPTVEFHPIYTREMSTGRYVFTGEYEEIDRRVDLTQEFRKGSLIDGEDDDYGY